MFAGPFLGPAPKKKLKNMEKINIIFENIELKLKIKYCMCVVGVCVFGLCVWFLCLVAVCVCSFLKFVAS